MAQLSMCGVSSKTSGPWGNLGAHVGWLVGRELCFLIPEPQMMTTGNSGAVQEDGNGEGSGERETPACRAEPPALLGVNPRVLCPSWPGNAGPWDRWRAEPRPSALGWYGEEGHGPLESFITAQPDFCALRDCSRGEWGVCLQKRPPRV